MTWLKLGRKCWHRPTKRPVEIISLRADGRVKIRPRDGKPLYNVNVLASELQVITPGLNNPRSPYTESELLAAKAWSVTPQQIRRIRRVR